MLNLLIPFSVWSKVVKNGQIGMKQDFWKIIYLFLPFLTPIPNRIKLISLCMYYKLNENRCFLHYFVYFDNQWQVWTSLNKFEQVWISLNKFEQVQIGINNWQDIYLEPELLDCEDNRSKHFLEIQFSDPDLKNYLGSY